MRTVFIIILIASCLPLSAQTEKIDEPYQKGNIIDGFQKGVWEYYDKVDELAIRIDYDNGKLLYLKTDTSQYFIKKEGEWILTSLDRYPRFMGSYVEIYNNLAQYFASRYPRQAVKDKIESELILELTIDKNGKIIDRKVVGENSEYFQATILEASALIPNFWIGAIYKGEAVESKIGFPISYKLNQTKKKKKKNGRLEKGSYNGKLMGEITVTGYVSITTTRTRH